LPLVCVCPSPRETPLQESPLSKRAPLQESGLSKSKLPDWFASRSSRFFRVWWIVGSVSIIGFVVNVWRAFVWNSVWV
jgi:hypothetical protein